MTEEMTDTHYIIYQYIDGHPVILILMMLVLFTWTYRMSRDNLVRVIKGDKSAAFWSSFHIVLAMWIMTGVIHITMEHWPAITGQESRVAFIHEHRYDVISEDSILHSPLCGCKQQDSGHYRNDSISHRINELIRKSMP